MDTWRRQKGEIHHHQDMRGTRSQNRRPPLANWQPTVPTWEKKFCTLVGAVPWQKLLETKRSMYLYDNVIQWNDSAGEEAFHNAKNRFWAQLNGLPCDIRLPDPDSYIDEIDWDSAVDPELLLDLEREPKVSEEKTENENAVVLSNALLFNHSFSCSGWGAGWENAECTGWENAECTGWENAECTGWNAECTGWENAECTGWENAECTGWGDAEEDFAKDNGISSNHNNEDWEIPGICDSAPSNNYSNMENTGWEDNWNASWGWNHRENSYSKWDNNEYCYADYRRAGNWGARDATRKKREGGSRYLSRYKTTRFHGNSRQIDPGWRNVRGRQRANFGHGPSPVGTRQWNSMNYCRAN